MIKQIIMVLLFCMLTAGITSASAEVKPLTDLLKDVRQFSSQDQQINQQREQRFNVDLQQQQHLLEQSRSRLEIAEQEQQALKATFDENNTSLSDLETLLQQRSAQLGEVFGVIKQNAAELQTTLQDSIASAEYPNRVQTLAFAESNKIPTLAELESLWYQLQLEMTMSGQISQFEGVVTAANGVSKPVQVIRIGSFSAITSEGEFLSWDIEQQQLAILPTQPSAADQSQAAAYAKGTADSILLDPSRGSLLSLLDRMPRLTERLHQGGQVGYLIIALGVVGLLVALWRLLMLLNIEIRVRKQLKYPFSINDDNPLGRVLLAVQRAELTVEQQELRFNESILRELPLLERGQSFIKLLAAVTPLLGLLGTVTGMIGTFQSITLFGTSDPKLMAGGISQALITTVLGLVVAIPLLFSHSLLSTRGRRLTQILQEKSLAVLAGQGQQVTKTREKSHVA